MGHHYILHCSSSHFVGHKLFDDLIAKDQWDIVHTLVHDQLGKTQSNSTSNKLVFQYWAMRSCFATGK